METAAIVKEYLEKKNIAAACRTEYVFVYQAELAGESRVSGCEVRIRDIGDDLLLTAILPVAVRVKEARGVARWLANLNDSRKKPGFFELDYLAGKIQFRVKMHGPLTEQELEVGVKYCLEQVEADSDQLIKLVCDESRAVREEEMEAIRKKQEAEARAGQTPMQNFFSKALSFIGLIDKPEIELEDEPDDERLTFRAIEEQEPQPELPETNEQPEEEDEEVFVEPIKAETAQPVQEEAEPEKEEESAEE